MAPKLKMNGLAKLLVICRLTPSSMEKIKNIAMRLSLNKVKAFRPNASTKLLRSAVSLVGHLGSVKV